MCSTFFIPKNLQASLIVKTSQLAAVNGLSPSARHNLFLGSSKRPCRSKQSPGRMIMGRSFMFYVVSHVLSRKVYGSLQCVQLKYMMCVLFGISQRIFTLFD